MVPPSHLHRGASTMKLFDDASQGGLENKSNFDENSNQNLTHSHSSKPHSVICHNAIHMNKNCTSKNTIMSNRLVNDYLSQHIGNFVPCVSGDMKLAYAPYLFLAHLMLTIYFVV